MSGHTALKKDPVEAITTAARDAVERLERERDEALASYDRLKEHMQALANSNKVLKNENHRLRGDVNDLTSHVKELQQQIQNALRERDQQGE